MRIASSVISGLGAAFGMLKGFLQMAFWLFLGLSYDWNSYVTLVVGTEGATAFFCILGGAGVSLVISGRRSRLGAVLMLIGAAGVTISIAVYGTTLPRLVPIDPTYASPLYYVVSLIPAAALLIGAALALFTHRPSRSQPASC